MDEAVTALGAPILLACWSALIGFIFWVSGFSRTPWHAIRWVSAATTFYLVYAFIQAKTGDGHGGLDIGIVWVLLAISLSIIWTYFVWGKASAIESIEHKKMTENFARQREWINEAEELKGK